MNVDRLVVCRAAPGERTIALSLARGLSQSDRLFPSVKKKQKQTNKQTKKKKKTRTDTNTKTRSHQRNGDHAQGSRRRLVSQSPNRRKERKIGGKHRSERGGQRRKMRKADRLSKSMLMELCKCQQMRCCPGEDGLRL